MSERGKKAPGIADYTAARRAKRKTTFLDEIDRIIDWKPLERLMNKRLKRSADAVGNPAYPALVMFKILLLQRWYNLSDEAVEEGLIDRLSFVRFVGLSLDDEQVPDATTICRFRNSLLERNLYKRLLDKLNHQLERGGVLVREGSIVDASVVSSARRPTKILDVLPTDREEPEVAPNVTTTYSDDADAAWLRKGRKAYYGYKMHVATDSRDGFVLGGHVTPANHSDIKELPRLLEEVALPPGGVVFADKGYSSASSREQVVRRGFWDGIMSKAQRNRPLSGVERKINRLISSVRSKVERVFGTFKRNYHLCRARYLGRDKVELEFHLVAMAFNLKKCWLMTQ